MPNIKNKNFYFLLLLLILLVIFIFLFINELKINAYSNANTQQANSEALNKDYEKNNSFQKIPLNNQEDNQLLIIEENETCDILENQKCWKLTWFDEFDYEGLPDSAKWDYEEGFMRNEELKQYYTRERIENARVEHGTLIIEGRKEIFSNARYNPNSWWAENREFAEYTSASLITLNKKSFMYGRIEVRAQVPQGSGVWPAIWMMGINKPIVNWPNCGEIDIMEFVGYYPNRILSALHYLNSTGHDSEYYELWFENPLSGFHVYALEWNEDRFDFYFDNNKYYSFYIDEAGIGNDNPFRKPNYLLINLGLGAAGGEIDDALMPQKYLIDYVRAYELKQ